MNVVFYGQMLQEIFYQVRNQCTSKDSLFYWDEESTVSDLTIAFEDADVLVSIRYDSSLPLAPNLSLLQLPGVGLELIDFNRIPLKTKICYVAEHENAMAEYAILGMLFWSHQFHRMQMTFINGQWDKNSRMQHTLHSELSGKTVGLIGFGRVNQEVARKLQNFDVNIVVCNRTPLKTNYPNMKYYPFDDLDSCLPECDFLVLACALTPDTHHLLNKNNLKLLKKTAVLINIGRGECIEEKSLYDACKNNRIGGAILDVWYNYPSASNPSPFPSQYPFHTLQNVFMTPHSSAWTFETIKKRSTIIKENIERLKNGVDLLNKIER